MVALRSVLLFAVSVALPAVFAAGVVVVKASVGVAVPVVVVFLVELSFVTAALGLRLSQCRQFYILSYNKSNELKCT